jgi:hypothetical protein
LYLSNNVEGMGYTWYLAPYLQTPPPLHEFEQQSLSVLHAAKLATHLGIGAVVGAGTGAWDGADDGMDDRTGEAVGAGTGVGARIGAEVGLEERSASEARPVSGMAPV